MKIGAWVTFLLLATIVGPELAFAGDSKEKDIDYFAEHSGLNDQHLRNFLSQDRCYTDENTFEGCIQAINVLLMSADTPVALTNSRTQYYTWAKQVVTQVEGIKVQKVSFDDKVDTTIPQIERMKKSVREINDASRAWKALYRGTKSKPVSIQKLLDYALSAQNTEFRATALAEAINLYLHIAVDAHANLLSNAARKAEEENTGESYFGIGSEILLNENKQVELTPMEGSPSLAAGLRKKDILTHIDGVAIPSDLKAQKDLDAITAKIKGTLGTNVSLSLLRGSEVVTLTITRGPIDRKNLSGKIISNPKTNQKIGYIRLYSFMKDGVCKDFVELAQSLHSQGAESLILDVRNNGGGSLTEVLCMAASYVDEKKTLLITQNPHSGLIEDTAKSAPFFNPFVSLAGLYNLYGKKPLVILQNAGSASASELLPGSLRAHGRVVTVGQRSFGKGTVQGPNDPEIFGLESIEGTHLMATIARFHFADKSSNQLVGIPADFEVYKTPNPTEEDKYARREADLFPNAVASAIKAPSALPERAKAKISKCMTARSDISGEYAKEESSPLPADYQLIVAKAVASCL